MSSSVKAKFWEQLQCLAWALAHIHNNKRDLGYSCVHMDLKPDNIVVTHKANSDIPSKWLIANFGTAAIFTGQLSESSLHS